jgi:hypothetical protein
MVSKTKQVLSNREITVLADTGYYNLSQIIDAVDPYRNFDKPSKKKS